MPSRAGSRRPRSPHEGCGRRIRRADTACASELRGIDRAWKRHESPSRPGATGASTASTSRSARVLFWDTLRQRGNNWIAHEAAGKPPVLAYEYEVLADARTFERPANYALVRIIPPKGVTRRRHAASVRHHRPARRPRSRHRRLQGGLRGRRRACAPATRCTSSSSIRIRSPARRSPTSPTPRRSSCASSPSAIRDSAEAGDRRQLPGRLGGDDARRRAARHRRPARDQRRADVVLGRQRRRQPDALRRRPARRRLARRCSRAILAAASSTARISSQNFESLNPANTCWDKYYHLFDEHRHRAAALPRVRALVGRLLPDERGGDPLDRQQSLRRQQAVAGRGAPRPGPLFRPQVDPLADHRVRVDGRQHHAAAAGVQLDRRRLRLDRGDQGERPDDRRPDARGRRPSRHLRVRQGREEGARADRRGAEVHPGAAARPVRHADQRDRQRRRQRSSTTSRCTSASSRT